MAGTRRTRAQGASPSGFKELPPATRTRRTTRVKAPANKSAANAASNATSTPSASQKVAPQPSPARPATPATPTPLAHQSPIGKRTAALIEEETDNPSPRSPKRIHLSPPVTVGHTTFEPPQTPVVREPERPVEQYNEHANDAAVDIQPELQVEPEQEPENIESDQKATHSHPNHEQEAQLPEHQQVVAEEPAVATTVSTSVENEQETESESDAESMTSLDRAFREGRDALLPSKLTEEDMVPNRMTKTFIRWGNNMNANSAKKQNRSGTPLRAMAPVQSQTPSIFSDDDDDDFEEAVKNYKPDPTVRRHLQMVKTGRRREVISELRAMRKEAVKARQANPQSKDATPSKSQSFPTRLSSIPENEQFGVPAGSEPEQSEPKQSGPDQRTELAPQLALAQRIQELTDNTLADAISSLLDHFASNGGPIPTADEMIHLLQAFQKAKRTEHDVNHDTRPQTPRTAPRKSSTPTSRTPVHRTPLPQSREALSHIPEENEDTTGHETPRSAQSTRGTHEQMQTEPRPSTPPNPQAEQQETQQNIGNKSTTSTSLPKTPVQQQSAQRSWASALSINTLGNMFRTPFHIWSRNQTPATAQQTKLQENSPSERLSATPAESSPLPLSPDSPAVDLDTPSKPARQLPSKQSTPDQSSQEQLETPKMVNESYQTSPSRTRNPPSPSPFSRRITPTTPETQRVVRRRPETERRNRPKPGQLWKYAGSASTQPHRYANWPMTRNADLKASQRIANENAAALEQQTQVGDKRKRAPKAYIHPKQSSGTFGLADDFFDMSDSDEEDAQSEKTKSPSKTPPSKKARVHEPEPDSDEEEVMVDYPVDHFPPSKYALENPAVYRECYDENGKQRNMFMRNGDWNMSIYREGVRQMEEQREREALAKELKAAAKAQNIFKAAEQNAPSTPPPPPAPSHAVLPTSKLLPFERENAPDLLAKAREAASKHKPTNPSKLRDVTAMSPLNQIPGTSVHDTPLQQKMPVPKVPQNVQTAPLEEEDSQEENSQKENIAPGQNTSKSVQELENPFQKNSARAEKLFTDINDPELEKYMEENPIKEQFDHIEFPPYKSADNTPHWLINIDQEVKDALDAIPEEEYLLD